MHDLLLVCKNIPLIRMINQALYFKSGPENKLQNPIFMFRQIENAKTGVPLEWNNVQIARKLL